MTKKSVKIKLPVASIGGAMKVPTPNVAGGKENFPSNETSVVYDYKIEDQIGKGAYAVVKRGIHIPTNTPVAVKIYDKIRFEEPRRKKRVSQEIAILRALSHPSIVKLHGTFETPKYLNVVMELVTGRSLYEYLKSKPLKKLPEKEALGIFRQIVAAIRYCHSQGVSHRDLKLENILIDPTNKITVIDFGFSVSSAEGERLKSHSGTPSYMAPEIVRKEAYLGPPADVWALGVVLFALVTGSYPFKGSNEKELFAKIKEGRYEFPEGGSEKVRQTIGRMLDMDPEKRPSCAEVLESELFMI